ncbi:MarR family winged helix-turn-helix transcriptional regulator [Agromyces subbeticus]|uniref:MarR family winged helix-turn-helix transcriptional regulator n=1 Tax=Agromyces subbeticus TaxID=293890 RepID=UPI00047C5906|nr:MarR family winged helix-turn-helix transcriptional regulator [Agromyces subbeticus]
MTVEPDTDALRAIAEVEQQFGRLFHRVRANWKRYATQLHPDLQPLGYKVVSTLVSRGPAHAGALAEELHTDKSVLSRQVRMLEELGLIESRVDERDARARLLAATPVAIERVNAIRRENQAELRERLGTWEPQEIEKFAELLGRLSDSAAGD